uniref:SURF6 domain-containing protein n=1 Tax=Syphacia muris TaxID=451379 RepID=A0A0N5ARA2_9BILA
MKQAESEEVKQVKYVDELLMSNINLIPIDNWGFDDETKEEMRTRKHRIVNSLLSDASKKKLSNAAKHLMAREVGSSFQTVTEVFNWLKHSSKGMRPRKRPLGNIQSTPEASSLTGKLGSENKEVGFAKLTKSQKRDKFTGKNFKGLLEKAEKRAERLEKIRKSNPDKAQYIEENILWNRAMNRTEGQKVKDDPVLLKKGAVKKEKVKERRKRKWDQRIDFVKRKQEKMQEKRIFNIQARKDMKKNKKLEKAREKGRIL